MSKIYQTLIILLILSIGGWFYWFHLRPSEIRMVCTKESYDAAHNVLVERINSASDSNELKAEYIKGAEGKFDQDWFENSYAACLHSKGL